MTTHQDSSSELEKDIREILSRTNHIFHLAAIHGQEWDGGDLVPEIMEAIKKDRQELLKRIEGELPKELKLPSDTSKLDLMATENAIHAHNLLLKQTKAIINAIRESI